MLDPLYILHIYHDCINKIKLSKASLEVYSLYSTQIVFLILKKKMVKSIWISKAPL